MYRIHTVQEGASGPLVSSVVSARGQLLTPVQAQQAFNLTCFPLDQGNPVKQHQTRSIEGVARWQVVAPSVFRPSASFPCLFVAICAPWELLFFLPAHIFSWHVPTTRR